MVRTHPQNSRRKTAKEGNIVGFTLSSQAGKSDKIMERRHVMNSRCTRSSDRMLNRISSGY